MVWLYSFFSLGAKCVWVVNGTSLLLYPVQNVEYAGLSAEPVWMGKEKKQSCYNKTQQDVLFLNFILVKNSTCFGQIYCPS